MPVRSESRSRSSPGADSVVVLVLDDRRQNILDKLGKRDRVELTRYAVRRGPIQP